MLNTQLELDDNKQNLVARLDAQPGLKELAKTKNIFAPNVYVKAFFVPAGVRVVTKAFREDHVTILAQGAVIVEGPDGKQTKYRAPAHTVFNQATRYRVLTLQDAVWYCVHPTQETDQDALIKMYE